MSEDVIRQHDAGAAGSPSLGRLRRLALVSVAAGAIGSVGLLLAAGHRSPQLLLLTLFVLWVLSPFAGFVLTDRLAKHWPAATRAALYIAMVIVSALSLAIYGRLIPPPARAAPAFAWLMVPLASWLILAIIVPLGARLSGRRSIH